MGIRYIGQVDNQNFVFPNNELAEYGDYIVHEINDISISGTVTNFTGTSITSTGMTFTHNYTWASNGGERYINDAGNLMVLSVHMMAGGQTYYKPWRLVDNVSPVYSNQTTVSGSNTITVTPSMVGLTTFVNGTYYFEIRFIGKRAIYPVCQTYVISTL
jgi:hypothetical protein